MDELTLLIRWALLALGVIYFLTESAIFAPVRVALARRGALLATLIYCASCTGFWVGLLAGAGVWPFDEPLWQRLLASAISAMALGAVWSAWKGGNPAWTAEAPLHDDETQEEARDDRAEETQDDAQG